MKDKPNVQLSILNEGYICSELAIKLPKWLNEARIKYNIFYEASYLRPIEHNRNTIVKRFLKSNRDFLIQIDHDNIPKKSPFELIDLMIEKNIDILSCPVWIYQEAIILNIYKSKGDYLAPIDYNKYSGLIEVDASGTGVLLCNRKVLLDIKKPFERIYDEDGIAILGQDLAFSQKAKAAGYKIFSHLDYISKHYKNIDLSKLNVNSTY